MAGRTLGVDIVSSQEQLRKKFGKKVAMCDKENHHIVLQEFDSMSLAAEYIIQNKRIESNVSTIRTHIGEVCRGKRKNAAGYYWKFI